MIGCFEWWLLLSVRVLFNILIAGFILNWICQIGNNYNFVRLSIYKHNERLTRTLSNSHKPLNTCIFNIIQALWYQVKVLFTQVLTGWICGHVGRRPALFVFQICCFNVFVTKIKHFVLNKSWVDCCFMLETFLRRVHSTGTHYTAYRYTCRVMYYSVAMDWWFKCNMQCHTQCSNMSQKLFQQQY